ncbi:MAG: hypothetical protein LBO68_02150 [Synergistaceae bacterium]|jgi:tetratricopeptide (TPR) repeat protein|nr:hypothetical protein [Synergistaceae bacterium]
MKRIVMVWCLIFTLACGVPPAAYSAQTADFYLQMLNLAERFYDSGNYKLTSRRANGELIPSGGSLEALPNAANYLQSANNVAILWKEEDGRLSLIHFVTCDPLEIFPGGVKIGGSVDPALKQGVIAGEFSEEDGSVRNRKFYTWKQGENRELTIVADGGKIMTIGATNPQMLQHVAIRNEWAVFSDTPSGSVAKAGQSQPAQTAQPQIAAMGLDAFVGKWTVTGKEEIQNEDISYIINEKTHIDIARKGKDAVSVDGGIYYDTGSHIFAIDFFKAKDKVDILSIAPGVIKVKLKMYSPAVDEYDEEKSEDILSAVLKLTGADTLAFSYVIDGKEGYVCTLNRDPKSAPKPPVQKGDADLSTDAAVIQSYPSLSAQDKNMLSIQHRSAYNLYTKKSYRKAYDAFSKLADDYKGNYLSAYWAGVSALRQNKKTDAAKWFDRALEINPKYQPALDEKAKLGGKK